MHVVFTNGTLTSGSHVIVALEESLRDEQLTDQPKSYTYFRLSASRYNIQDPLIVQGVSHHLQKWDSMPVAKSMGVVLVDLTTPLSIDLTEGCTHS